MEVFCSSICWRCHLSIWLVAPKCSSSSSLHLTHGGALKTSWRSAAPWPACSWNESSVLPVEICFFEDYCKHLNTSMGQELTASPNGLCVFWPHSITSGQQHQHGFGEHITETAEKNHILYPVKVKHVVGLSRVHFPPHVFQNNVDWWLTKHLFLSICTHICGGRDPCSQSHFGVHMWQCLWFSQPPSAQV